MKGLKLKTISLLIFYVWLVKSEKLVNAGTVDQLEKYGLFFLISSMVLGLLHHLQMFWQFHLIKLLKFVTGLGLLQLQYLIYPRLLTDFAILFSLTKRTSYDISGQIFGLICSSFSYAMLRVVLDWKCAQEY